MPLGFFSDNIEGLNFYLLHNIRTIFRNGDLLIDRNFLIYAYGYILWNDINDQLIDRSDSLLIALRNLILFKFIKYIKLYFTYVYVKKKKRSTELVQRIHI